MNKQRVGGHLVAESLIALGAEWAIGLPGQHALGTFDGLAQSELRYVGFRTEVAASFGAHAAAVVSGSPAPLLLSTGPGALMSLAGLQEAETTGAPVVCICPEIPRDALSRNKGHVHELRDQIAHFAPLVKRAYTVPSDDALPDVIAAAWREAQTPPSGPVFVQIPVDILSGPTSVAPGFELSAVADRRPAPEARLTQVADLLRSAETVTILAGGGVLRAGAWDELAELANRLGAPVVQTFGGKGVFPDSHPLCAGSACEDTETMELLGNAEVALVVGSSLSEETCNHYALRVRGLLVQIDPDVTRLTTNYPAITVAADAKLALQGLLDRLSGKEPAPDGAERAARVRRDVTRKWDAQGRSMERGILRDIEQALPDGGISAWDMTIMAYWAAMDFAVAGPRQYVCPQGSGTLGYGYPAALGAKVAAPDRPTLGVAGDGGFMYGIAELANARQNNLDAKLLLIDDGGYGVLREYQRAAFGRTYATDLTRPDFPRLFEAFGVPAQVCEPDGLAIALERAFDTHGPAAVVLRAAPTMFLPTHP